MLTLLLSVAVADPCPDPAAAVEAAQVAFEDAEVELARAEIDRAREALLCAPAPVDRPLLQDLYGFDAVVAYAAGDQRRTVEALMRLRTAFPEADPHPMFGPELTELSDTWAERVGEASVRVLLVAGEALWVDGARLGPGEDLRVVPGEHLLQGTVGGAFRGARETIAAGTGVTLTDDFWLAAPPQAGPVDAGPPPIGPPPPPRAPAEGSRKRRQRRGGLIATSVVAAAAGGATLGYAWSRERRFLDDPYAYDAFGDCARGQPCYEQARVDAIRADALNVRVLYLVGYGLSATGVGLLGAELFVLPAPRAEGAVAGLRGTF